MISINNLTMNYPVQKRYREYLLKPFSRRKIITALKDVNLQIKNGERVAFLGPNGAGKTTLFKLIGGLLLPSRGEIIVNGFNTLSGNIPARNSVGIVMNEERSFYWRLTGRQNLEFFGSLENIFGKKLNAKIDKLLELVGLKDNSNKPVSTYSSGMKQRLAIARSLLKDPAILILDEPTRALDPVSAEEYMNLILNKIHADNKSSLLIVTHRLEIVPKLCSRICIIDKGRVTMDENIQTINSKYKSIQDYYKKGVAL
jgi:ABC-2 type transport system ATP-binding protein